MPCSAHAHARTRPHARPRPPARARATPRSYICHNSHMPMYLRIFAFDGNISYNCHTYLPRHEKGARPPLERAPLVRDANYFL